MTLNEQLEQTILRRRLRYIQKKDRLFSKRLQREYEDVSDINSTVNTLLTLVEPFKTTKEYQPNEITN